MRLGYIPNADDTDNDLRMVIARAVRTLVAKNGMTPSYECMLAL
jgi:hypothetical protein